MSISDSTPLRFVASLGVALCVVSSMLWFALEVSGFVDHGDRPALQTHAVDLLSEAERRQLGDLLGGARPSRAPAMLEPTPIARGGLGQALRGIVRLEVDVDAAGQVAGVRVIDADPAGVYEAQAMADVRRREYTPQIVAGRRVPSRRLEVVNFTLTPATSITSAAE